MDRIGSTIIFFKKETVFQSGDLPKSPKPKEQRLVNLKTSFYYLCDSDLEKLGAVKNIFLAING